MLIECVIIAAIVFGAYAISRPSAVATLGRLYDDVVYLSVGKSIADGHGYRSAHLVGTPVQAKFPPLLPAIYAMAWISSGSLDAVARFALWLNIVVVSTSAGALWWLARKDLRLGVVSTAVFAIVPIVTDRAMFYFSGAASEPWMLLGWTVSLMLVSRLMQPVATGASPANVAAIALGLTLALTVLSRSQGIAIAVGVFVGLVVSRVGWRAILVAGVVAVVPLLAWSVWHAGMLAKGPVSPLPDQRSYLSWIPVGGVGELAGFVVRMTRTSAPLYWSNVAAVLVGWTSPKTLLLAAALLLSGLIGVVMLARTFPAMAATIVAVVGMLVIWPYVQDRFLTPVLPILGIAGAFAVERTLARVPRAFQRGATVLAAVAGGVLLIENARLRAESVRGEARSPFVHAVANIVEWVDRNTMPDDHLMVSWGGAVYLRTGRRTSIPNPEEPTLGASVLVAPYRFYATRLLADSVDDVIIWDRAPGRAAPWLRQLGTRCRGLLTESVRDSLAAESRNGVHFYRVQRNLPCLALEARGEATATTENKNAP